MSKLNIHAVAESSVNWETLEDWARTKVQGWLQDLLEAEVTELLGREKSERKKSVDAVPGYRNGHGKPRRLTMGAGTVAVRRPRLRGLEERFEGQEDNPLMMQIKAIARQHLLDEKRT